MIQSLLIGTNDDYDSLLDLSTSFVDDSENEDKSQTDSNTNSRSSFSKINDKSSLLVQNNKYTRKKPFPLATSNKALLFIKSPSRISLSG